MGLGPEGAPHPLQQPVKESNLWDPPGHFIICQAQMFLVLTRDPPLSFLGRATSTAPGHLSAQDPPLLSLLWTGSIAW